MLPDSLSVARSCGLLLRQKGNRHWTCCPLHGEKTPSMCFFPDGKWHCFGCGAHGDAADLYAALHGVSIGEALQLLRGENTFQKNSTKTTATDLRRKVETWKSQRWAEACRQKHAAAFLMEIMERQHSMESLMQNERFWTLVAQKCAAEDCLNLLSVAAPAHLLQMMAEENVS